MPGADAIHTITPQCGPVLTARRMASAERGRCIDRIELMGYKVEVHLIEKLTATAKHKPVAKAA